MTAAVPYVYMGKRKMPSHASVYHYWRMKGTYAGADRFTCFGCGWKSPSRNNLDRAHIIPRCEGGTDTEANIHLLCHMCHRLTEFWVERGEYFQWMDEHSPFAKGRVAA